MRIVRRGIVVLMMVFLFSLAATYKLAGAEDASAKNAGAKKTGYASKRPVFGGACRTCPWGSIAEIVKAAMQPYGYDIQICYTCAGGPREARMVSGAMMPTPPRESAEVPLYLTPPPPTAPIDFGATGSQFLWWAYQGAHDFAKDPEGPRKQLRLVANIQEPSYFLVAVRADSGITDLHQIKEKRMAVRVLASTSIGGETARAVLDYYGLTKDTVESLGGELRTSLAPDQRKNLDVVIGWAALENAPEYNMWYEISQKYDLKFLKLADDLIAKLDKEYDLEEKTVPLGLLRGINTQFPTAARTGNTVYGRTDMPDDFAYTLAKALDEHQDLFQWANSGMNFSYNWRTVWKAFGVPLHPGAAKYYREKGYMK
jgi:uncharacterized protein